MKRMNLRKALSAGILIGATAVAASAVANPPQGNVGPDYGMGGYGILVPILLTAVVVGLVAWVVTRTTKKGN